MATIRIAIREGWISALKLAVGAGLFDVIYCALAMLATTAVVSLLTSLEATSPLAPIAIQFSIVVMMIVFGIMQMRERPVKKIEEDDDEVVVKRSGLVEWVKGHGPFFVGVGFALANLANPTFVPALAAMTTFVQKLEWFQNDLANNLAFALGFGLGNFLWLLTLVRLVLAYRHKMTLTFILRIQQVSGATLIGFGAFYGIRIILLTKWSVLFRLVFAA
jgi:threonine/homoserine/homoserine lactone efflux protein